ncbi:hypothetical protein [Methanolobus psychrotolerans]|uniref:hypothetical protein n=1 Tax=Methanolobus psychrotolerans TaxID=1874706 RepID=UPI000B919675|nr:hypothetical protein [Methanolobus psychrotolerans]
MINLYQYKVTWCPVCNQGWVEIAKDVNSKRLFLLCEECESEWDEPNNIKNSTSTRDKYGLIEVPLLEEIRKKKWDQYIVKDPHMYNAKIFDISGLSKDKNWDKYAENWGIGNKPTESHMITCEMNGILLKARGENQKKWKSPLIGKTIKVTNYFVSIGDIYKTDVLINGILQIENNVYSVIGEVTKIDNNGINFILDCGSIVTAAKRYSGLKNIKKGDRIVMDPGEFYISNVELETD